MPRNAGPATHGSLSAAHRMPERRSPGAAVKEISGDRGLSHVRAGSAFA